jgi:hypothetical protein
MRDGSISKFDDAKAIWIRWVLLMIDGDGDETVEDSKLLKEQHHGWNPGPIVGA